jgi:predicted esterase
MADDVRTIATSFHGRYVVRACRAGVARGLLVGFHGYGQNAAGFVGDLEPIPGAEAWHVVSIQALNRFYTKSGEVVANWMTKEDRDVAIADNVAYTSAVIAAVEREFTPVATVYAGFSQGVAMAFRAAARGGRPCRGVIALGGDIPPELRADGALRLPAVLLGRGTRDEWYTAEKLATDEAWLRATNTMCRIVAFDGGHEWTDVFRQAAGEFLLDVTAGR